MREYIYKTKKLLSVKCLIHWKKAFQSERFSSVRDWPPGPRTRDSECGAHRWGRGRDGPPRSGSERKAAWSRLGSVRRPRFPPRWLWWFPGASAAHRHQSWSVGWKLFTTSDGSGLTQLMETLSDVIPEKSPLSWNMSERPISFRFSIKS